MIISHKHKFIFIHPQRGGGTSITSALIPVLGKDDEIYGCEKKYEILSEENRVKNIKELRVSTEIELKSIAHKTKISLKNLKSIENLDFDKLPSEPWRNSFITQYCECIENFSKKEN